VIVLDHTTAPLATQHPALLSIAASAPLDPRDRVVIPLLCLVSALGNSPAGTVASDLGALEGLDFAPLDFTAFHHIEQLVGAGAPWGLGHAVHIVQASGPQAHDRYDSVIITTDPNAYVRFPDIVAIDLTSL
jgi:hypothetical protein